MAEFKGSCLCTTIQFSLSGLPHRIFACYCDHCSLNAGGPCQLVARFSRSQLTVQDPNNSIVVFKITTGTESGHAKEKHFCGTCGCTLWTVPLKHHGQVVIVRTSLIRDGLHSLPPDAECFARNKPSYFAGCEGVPVFGARPDLGGIARSKQSQ